MTEFTADEVAFFEDEGWDECTGPASQGDGFESGSTVITKSAPGSFSVWGFNPYDGCQCF